MSRRSRARRDAGLSARARCAPSSSPASPSPLWFWRGRGARRGVVAGLACVLGVAVSGVGESLVGVRAAAAVGSGAGSDAGSGSLAAALGSLGGVVDERTGQVSFAVPLGSVAGPADSGLGVSALFSQLQAWAGADRFGLGAGWSWGLAYMDVERGKLVLPSGEYALDDSQASGLVDYRLKDVRFSASGGSDPVGHAYVLESVKDGSRQFFDAQGDPVAVQDRFGHTTTLVWQQVGGKHRLVSVTGPLGGRLSVAYSGSKVTVTSPAAAGQSAGAASVVQLSGGRLASVTDAAGNRTVVEWSGPMGGAGLVAPVAVTSATGARTAFEYRTYDERSGGVVAVSGVRVAGADGRELVAPLRVSLDPDGAIGGRNWTGCPQHCADGADRLARSGDAAYTYRVMWAQVGTGVQAERTYNALHQKTGETSRVREGGQERDASRVAYTYPGVSADRVPPVQDAPANYQTPTGSTVTTVDPADSSRTREASARSEYDGMGRAVLQEAGGVRTTTQYGANSQPTRTETTDLGTGAKRIVDNTLTGDGRAIARAVTTSAEPGAEPVVVSTERYTYHDGQLAGEVAQTRTTGAAGADGGDPGEVRTDRAIDLRRNADGTGTRTDTVTGPDRVPTTAVSDLSTGRVLSQRTGDAPAATADYDVAGRVVRTTAPDGTVTTTDYRVEQGGTRTTSTRQSDGLATRTSTDELGRQIRTESNYQPAEATIGGWRQTSAAGYDTSGRQVSSTDAAGRATTTDYDAYSRPSQVTGPDGTRTRNHYDETTGTTTSALTPAGADRAAVTGSQTVDENGNPVIVGTTYGDGTPGSRQETRYDAFERPLDSEGSSPFAVTHDYGPTGAPSGDTVTHTGGSTDPAPGGEVRSGYARDALGNTTGKTLTGDGQEASGWRTAYDTAGRVVRSTAPGTDTPATTAFNPANALPETVVRADGSSGHYRYDALGRVTESWSSPAGNGEQRESHVRTGYDALTGQVAATWFADDEAGTRISYSYNPDGSVKQRTDPGGKSTAYTYTDLGQVRTLTDHTGAATEYTYDRTTGRLTDATQTRDGKQLATVSYTYDGSGRLTAVDRGNGATSRYTYNDAGKATGEKHTGPGGTLIAEHAYTHTPAGQQATDTSTGPDGSRTVTAYTYDQSGRLTGSHHTQGHTPGQGELISRTAYAYDVGGNLTGQAVTTTADGAEKTTTTEYAHDSASRTTHVTVDGQRGEQTYDAAGRLTLAADGTRHAYSASGQPTGSTSPDGTTVRTTYTPSGERATQTTTGPDGTVHTLTYHPGTETDQDGATATYMIGTTRESRTLTGTTGQDQGPDTAYYLTDRHGDKTHTLDQDGKVTAHTAYTDYGAPRATAGGSGGSDPGARAGAITANPYGYAGGYTTPIGHQALGARMYNPYTYATGDPVNYTDPTGRSPIGDWLSKAINWQGLPYLDIGIAFAAVGITLYTGGAGAPLALALIGAAATLPSAADQIARDTTGNGFLNDEQRLGFAIAGVTGAGADIVIGGASTYKAVKAANGGGSARAVRAAAPVAAASSVPADAPTAGQVTGLWNRVKGNVPQEVRNSVDEAAFVTAYGDGSLSEDGHTVWGMAKAEARDTQNPPGGFAEAEVLRLSSVAGTPDAQRYADLIEAQHVYDYLGTKQMDMTVHLVGAAGESGILAVGAMQIGIGKASVAIARQMDTMHTWLKVVDHQGVVVLDNGGLLRAILTRDAPVV